MQKLDDSCKKVNPNPSCFSVLASIGKCTPTSCSYISRLLAIFTKLRYEKIGVAPPNTPLIILPYQGKIEN